ncbi:hypothetical protein Q5P01_006815 [Channa striata]|uniref:Uncharacterized protein n=1 Tax=Channa striata TaxID=64152 RepID=A0AA88NEX8_CHASR|nr:hypothetical protein Q5P01_006815 [Channa striata]
MKYFELVRGILKNHSSPREGGREGPLRAGDVSAAELHPLLLSPQSGAAAATTEGGTLPPQQVIEISSNWTIGDLTLEPGPHIEMTFHMSVGPSPRHPFLTVKDITTTLLLSGADTWRKETN